MYVMWAVWQGHRGAPMSCQSAPTYLLNTVAVNIQAYLCSYKTVLNNTLKAAHLSIDSSNIFK